MWIIKEFRVKFTLLIQQSNNVKDFNFDMKISLLCNNLIFTKSIGEENKIY